MPPAKHPRGTAVPAMEQEQLQFLRHRLQCLFLTRGTGDGVGAPQQGDIYGTVTHLPHGILFFGSVAEYI